MIYMWTQTTSDYTQPPYMQVIVYSCYGESMQ